MPLHQAPNSFAYTNYTFQPQQPTQTYSKFTRPQSSGTIRHTSPLGPRLKNPATTTVPRPETTKQGVDEKISERFKNRAYNRHLSPSPFTSGLCQRPISPKSVPARAAVSQRPALRERVPQRLPATKAPVVMSHSELMKKKLEEKCQKPNLKSSKPSCTGVIPKMSESERIDSLEDKVFHAVKDVLSRAVLERGRIDENNINSIFSDMKKRLMDDDSTDDSSDDENENIGESLKHSKTSVCTEPVSKNNTVVIAKPKLSTGIIRKTFVEPPKKSQYDYKKVYERDETTSLRTCNEKKDLSDDPEKVMYIDLPDTDYSNFNLKFKKEEGRKVFEKRKADGVKNIESIGSKKDHLLEALKENILVGDSKKQYIGDFVTEEENVGDCQGNDVGSECQPWRSEDDVKLQKYIEALIRNMNDQLRGKLTSRAFESHFETENTICKSFCVCKVCVSNKPTTRNPVMRTLLDDTSREKNQPKIQLKRSETKNNLVTSNAGKFIKNQLMLKKESNKEVNCKVLQRNSIFQPESKSSMESRHAIGGAGLKQTPSSNSYVEVTQEEANEDFYLQRRMKKSPSRRPSSSKV